MSEENVIEKIIKGIFGDLDTKKLKQYTKELQKVKALESTFENFKKEDIQKKTQEFQQKFEWLDFQNEEDSKQILALLEEIKYEAFAIVKQACKLLNGEKFTFSNGKEILWNMIPYDVQIIGGLAIHEGNISEMKTGEWKTLVATLPTYLNALTGNTVHIVTVNDYLAIRDAEEMGILYNFLGLSVGVVTNSQSREQKQESYAKNVIYATNNELGFDYLRDNMVTKKDGKSQSPLFFGIIDEVDSILIDEARTPLIISMPDNEPTTKYLKFSTLAKNLKSGTHYKVDEKQKTATLTEDGIKKVEELLHVDNIYVSDNYNDLHHIENAIKASAVYIRDKDYILNDNEVMIVDEHTGRVLAGRRYSDGLHQALEAKEGVEIKQESKTLASITFQNYFRMYWKLAGMTGTAKTEEEEFYKVYSLETISIPTNKPIAREDRKDLLFKNEKGKFEYVIELIKELHESGRPILVGTVSVDKSEYLSKKLKEAGVKHNVLNAKQHEKEAEVVGAAGQKWAVTIATNMAGRGTDIKLGEGVVELGGLVILGTEKHETRRIDNQLRGRAGRQWDPGMTQFLISPNDDIMRIFWGDKLFGVFNSSMFASLPDNEPLTQSSMLTRKVTSVQKQVEGHNFDVRKHILQYDDVINKHREIIYGRRNTILGSENIDENVRDMIMSQVGKIVRAEMSKSGTEEEKKQKTIAKVNEFLWVTAIDDTLENQDIAGTNDPHVLAEYIGKIALEEQEKLKKKFSSDEDFYRTERRIVLQSIDRLWMEHIDSMSKLREQVAFEWYAQKQPLVVYKEKAYDKFQMLIDEIEYKVVKSLFFINPDTVVKQIKIEDGDIQMNEAEVEKMLSSFSEWKKENSKQQKSSWNPLFAQPQGTWGNANAPKKRIRV